MGISGLGGSLISGVSSAKLAELYELVKDGGMSLAEAMRKLGIDKKISEKTAQHLLKTRYGLQIAAGGGGSGIVMGTLTAIGEWLGLSGAAATVAGGLILTAALGVATYGVANLAGRLAGDNSVEAGPRGDKAARIAKGDIPSRPGAVESTGNSSEKYYVYVLEISGGSVWIGQESTLKNTPSCKFAGGGLCEGEGNNPPKIIRQSQAYDTETEANTAWCDELRGKQAEHWAVAGDSKASVYGGKYWLGLAPGCN